MEAALHSLLNITTYIYFFSVREIQKNIDLSEALICHFSIDISSTPLSEILKLGQLKIKSTYWFAYFRCWFM